MPPREPSSTTSTWLVWLHDIFLIRPNRGSMTPLFVWAPLALLSMGAASAVAWLRPESLGDLWLVREWLGFWLAGGNPFRQYLGDDLDSAGMPADVFIKTGERTPLDYMLSPFVNSISKSFREQ